MQAYPLHQKQIQIGPYSTSKKELTDLSKAWVVIALAFAIVQYGFNLDQGFLWAFFMSAITVGVAFLLHELAHKISAQYYGCFAEFRSSDTMLMFGLLMSFIGFIFFAPGAVMIAGPVGKKRSGVIAAAGPITNFVLAILFLMSMFYIQSTLWMQIATYGYLINTWLGLFNMLPVWVFDGKKIITWNKQVYYGMVILGVVLLFSKGLLGGLL